MDMYEGIIPYKNYYSVGGQGGWKKRQRTKKKELDWQR